MENTLEMKNLTDDQVESEVKDIQAKGKEASQEEKDKLSELKEERQTRYQKRLDKLTWEKKTAEEERERLKSENEELKKKQTETEQARHKPDVLDKEETIVVAGKKYFTDAALKAMVQADELTAEKAWDYAKKRDKEETKAELLAEIDNRGREKNERQTRDDDLAEVMRQYPHFSDKHPDFDKNDPLYKVANEIWSEGYHANPKGMTLAIAKAKKILRLEEERPDVSDHHTVGKTRVGQESIQHDKNQATLSPEEQDLAVRTYVMGNAINPETGRVYTEKEAINKATKAKATRARK